MGLKDVQGITDINSGSIDELFKREWPKVLENIGDPATEAQAKRKIIIEIEIVPSKNRDSATVVTKSKATLAPAKSDQGAVFLDLTSHGIIASTREPEIQPELEELEFPKKSKEL
jgi:hypothetical protein